MRRPNEEPDAQLVTRYYGGDSDQYKADESAIAIGATDSVLMGVEKFLRFPGIKGALQHFQLGEDLELIKEFPEYILLYGKPQIQSSSCPYVPRAGISSTPAIADDLSAMAISPCGEVPGNADPQFFVVYPMSTTIIALANEKQVAAISVDYDDYAYSTLYYWAYDVAAVLKKCDLAIDPAVPSLELSTEWKLVGGGVIGAIAACTRIKLPLEKGALTNSMFYLTLKVEPCLDDKALYIKTSYVKHHHHVEWNSLLLQAALTNPVKNAVDGAFGDAVFTKIADSMQVKLLEAGGWGLPLNIPNQKSSVRVWSQDVRIDSLLIALTLSRD